MLSDLTNELTDFISHSKAYIYLWLITFAIFWGINILNWILGSRLSILGIYPRHLIGLVGIPFAPLWHQNFNHLFFNSIPLFALGLAILASGPNIFLEVTLFIILFGGLLVWLFGRRALHIGASGLVSGYFGYILTTAVLHPNVTSLLLGSLVAYYFGSIFLGIFPEEEKVSWESHLFGFISGILSSYLVSYYPLNFENLIN